MTNKINLNKKGHLHLVTQTIKRISDIFVEMGFEIADGPEIEDEYHNFDALNAPKDHPSRDLQDTFWLKPMPDGRQVWKKFNAVGRDGL